MKRSLLLVLWIANILLIGLGFANPLLFLTFLLLPFLIVVAGNG
jgi:hypothetical protein